ncbi:hypothetical protein F4815DRAFT_473875 [Daldinia loculata]|nr:hypothetical protein F4815DRAFT_473875 [Daldinia loculata]
MYPSTGSGNKSEVLMARNCRGLRPLFRRRAPTITSNLRRGGMTDFAVLYRYDATRGRAVNAPCCSARHRKRVLFFFFFFGFFPFSSSVIKKGGDDWGVAFLLMRRPLQHYTYMETRKLETHKIRLYLANSISDFSGRGLSEVVVGLAWFGLYLLSWPGGFNYKGSG